MASNRAVVRYYQESLGSKKSITFAALLRFSLAEDPSAMAVLQRMAEQLGRGMRMVAAALAPEEIVIVGEITAAWHQVGPIVDAQMRKHSLAAQTRLRPAYDGAAARLRSAVALVLSRSLPGLSRCDGDALRQHNGPGSWVTLTNELVQEIGQTKWRLR